MISISFSKISKLPQSQSQCHQWPLTTLTRKAHPDRILHQVRAQSSHWFTVRWREACGANGSFTVMEGMPKHWLIYNVVNDIARKLLFSSPLLCAWLGITLPSQEPVFQLNKPSQSHTTSVPTSEAHWRPKQLLKHYWQRLGFTVGFLRWIRQLRSVGSTGTMGHQL